MIRLQENWVEDLHNFDAITEYYFQYLVCIIYIYIHIYIYIYMCVCKGKGLPQQAELAQGFPGRLRSWIFLTFSTTKVVGR